jgi:deazaflavin-dependent oxidoreductase (nitroreductase family)
MREAIGMALPDDWATTEYCYLTTAGRRTGNPHTVEIWFEVDGDDLWLMTEVNEADWVKNLRASGRCRVKVNEIEVDAIGTVVDDLPADAPQRSRLATKYQPGWTNENLHGWAAQALAVRIRPDACGGE